MGRLIKYVVVIGCLHFGASANAAESLEAGVEELAQQIIEHSKTGNKQTIAVAAFPHTDQTLSVLSNYLVDELVLSLSRSNLQIVERSQLELIMEELVRGRSGTIDIDTAKQLGRLHGVDALVIGSITDRGDTIRVIARLIGTETGKVFSAAATSIPKTKAIESLMRQSVRFGTSRRTGVRSPTVGTGSARAGAPSESVFMNDLLRAEVISAVVSEDGRDLRFTVQLENISRDKLILFAQRLSASAVDDQGNGFEGRHRSSVHGIVGCRRKCGKRGTTMNPGESKIVAFNLETRSRVLKKGTIASFTAHLIRRIDGKLHPLEVRFPRVPLTIGAN